MRTIVVGSRQSELALTQTNSVVKQLEQLASEHGLSYRFEIKTYVTKGDRQLETMLSKVGGKGLFVKEIEHALLDKHIDLAVHSMKDLPAQLPYGLTIGSMPARADARDCLLSLQHESLAQLPSGAKIGTSSLRRASQIKAYRPDLTTAWIRGNVGSRINKLEAGEFDAIILAVAGLQRLGWEDVISEVLSPDVCLPAVGQGALGVQCRVDDEDLLHLLSLHNDITTSLAVQAERSLLKRLDGNCAVPIGAYAVVNGEQISLTGMVGSPNGELVIKESMEGKEPIALGVAVAESMMARGAARILEKVRDEG